MKHTKLFLILVIFVFCSSENAGNFSKRVADGVTYITNHTSKQEASIGISLEFSGKFGEFESDNENLQFYKPADVDEDKNGNVYILEEGNCRIQKFSPGGKFLASFGRKGQGPGEFSEPKFLSIRNDSIFVRESASDDITVLDLSGNEIRKIILMKSVSKGYGENTFVSVSSDFLYLPSGNIVSAINDEQSLLGLFEPGGTLIKSFVKRREYSVQDDDKMQVIIFPYIMNKISFAADHHGNIYTAFFNQNRIEKWSPDAELMIQISREKDFPETTVFEKKMKQVKMTIGGREVISEQEMPAFNMFCSGIQIDGKGRIWTAGIIRQPESRDEALNDFMRLEVFNSDGILLGRIPFPEKASHVFRIKQDRIYFIDTKETMCIFRYRIKEL